MRFEFNRTGAERKALVQAMGEILEVKPKYLGMPTAAYQVDYFHIDKTGAVEFNDRADSKEIESLMERLAERGIIAVAALLCSPVITLVACHRINRYNDMRTEKGKGSRTPIFRREPCSGTTIKTWLLYQDMKWNTRRTKIFLINSKEECICPCCGSPLKYRDSRKRVHKVAGGGKEWYLIRRLRCSSDKCGKLHNELPDCICPYKHYDAGLIEDVADGVVSEVDTETEDYPCEGTMKHWRWWLWMNEKNMEGHLRLAAHRFLDLDGKFLKSRASLLEEMKERISPGWLKAAARVIYNSGGRIEPYPSVA